VWADGLSLRRSLFIGRGDLVELSWWKFMDLHPCFDGESFVSVVGIVIDQPSVACAEHVLMHFLR